MTLTQPNWNNRQDRMLYEELLHKKNKTEQEEKFCITMYHLEEYASGLDGDRE